MKDSGMPILAVARMEVEVEEALLLLRLDVNDAEEAHRGVPRVELVDLDELEPEQLLVDLERRLYDVVQGKIGAYRLVVDALRGSGIETTPRRWRVSAQSSRINENPWDAATRVGLLQQLRRVEGHVGGLEVAAF